MSSTDGSVSRSGSPGRRTNVRWLMVFLAFVGLSVQAGGARTTDTDEVSQEAGAANWVGSIGGIQYFASNLAGITSPTGVGFLVGATGTYVTGLVTAGVLSIIGAISHPVIIGRVEPLPALEQTSQPGAG